MLRMPECFVDMTITSPPYDNMRKYEGNNNIQFKKIAKELYRITKKGAVVVWIIGDQTKNWDESGTSFMQCLYFKEMDMIKEKIENQNIEKNALIVALKKTRENLI